MIPTKINLASLLCCFQIVFSMLFNMLSMLLHAAYVIVYTNILLFFSLMLFGCYLHCNLKNQNEI